ncbi:hypothetical protein ABZ671_16775 [Micromonospora sp. NPDC006766]|uniref:hypothetical protein n=1 Tax=Micromonospora sp. NPDC006766 TaxID=3154778 RepID=UPI003411DBD3
MRGTIHKSKPLQAALLSMAAAVATLGVAATPAQAASANCTAPYWSSGWYRTCTTGSVPAHRTGRFIDVTVGACYGTDWKVWDINTGVTVASGRTAGRPIAPKRIYGLYGTYKAKLIGACWKDWIKIDNE